MTCNEIIIQGNSCGTICRFIFVCWIIDDNKEEDDEDEATEMSNEDLIRTVAEKSNVVTFFCEYFSYIIFLIMQYLQ